MAISDPLQANDQWRVPVSSVRYGMKEDLVPLQQSHWEWGGLVALKDRDLYFVRTTMILAVLFFFLTQIVVMFAFKSNVEKGGKPPVWIYIAFLLSVYLLLLWYMRKILHERMRYTTENELTPILGRLGWRIDYDDNRTSDGCFHCSLPHGSYVFSRSLEAHQPTTQTTITAPVTVDVAPSPYGLGLHLLFPKHTELSTELLWLLGGLNEEIVRNHAMPILTMRVHSVRTMLVALFCCVSLVFLYLSEEFERLEWLFGILFGILFVSLLGLNFLVDQVFKRVVDNSGHLERACSENISPLFVERSGCRVEYKKVKGCWPKIRRQLIITPISSQHEQVRSSGLV